MKEIISEGLQAFVGICGIIAAFIIMSVVIMSVFLLWGILWVFGMPIIVKEEGKVVGHYQWFTFHRK